MQVRPSKRVKRPMGSWQSNNSALKTQVPIILLMATDGYRTSPVVKGPVTSYDYTMNLLDFVSWHILAKAEVINLEVLA